MVHNKLQQSKRQELHIRRSYDWKHLSAHLSFFAPLKMASCWAGSNVLKGSQRATLLRMSQPWVAGSAETRVDVNLRFGSRLQVSPWSIHESSIPTRRVKRPHCPARNVKAALWRVDLQLLSAAKILDAFSFFPFISFHIHSCHFLPSFIIFSHFSPHQGSSFRSI